MESFISTMETSALMGMNVAKLIVDEMGSLSPPGEDHLAQDRVRNQSADLAGAEL
jgi:Prenylcysteine lyase